MRICESIIGLALAVGAINAGGPFPNTCKKRNAESEMHSSAISASKLFLGYVVFFDQPRSHVFTFVYVSKFSHLYVSIHSLLFFFHFLIRI